MTYITTKRFKTKAMCGPVNIPYGVECEAIGNTIFFHGLPLCYTTSQNAHDYFARNDDGQGLMRGKIIQDIQKMLSDKRDQSRYEYRWSKIWANDLCYKYKRVEHEDFWLWNHEFYNAPIEDLQYIANLVDSTE